MATKKNIKVRDLKPRKDAKGGIGGAVQGTRAVQGGVMVDGGGAVQGGGATQGSGATQKGGTAVDGFGSR